MGWHRAGLNAKLAKSGLHDIGKVQRQKGTPHCWECNGEIRREERCVCTIEFHRDEIGNESLIAPIVQVCDAISGARQGARRQVLDLIFSD